MVGAECAILSASGQACLFRSLGNETEGDAGRCDESVCNGGGTQVGRRREEDGWVDGDTFAQLPSDEEAKALTVSHSHLGV